MSETDHKIRRAYFDSINRVLKLVPVSTPITKEIFDAMWSENFIHIASSKYTHKVHNTAAMMIIDNFLRPLGIALGFVQAEKRASSCEQP